MTKSYEITRNEEQIESESQENKACRGNFTDAFSAGDNSGADFIVRGTKSAKQIGRKGISMKYVIEISDADGNTCQVKLSLPLFKNHTKETNSNWKVLDEGLLKHRSGSCRIRSSTGKREQFVSGDLYLLDRANSQWGVKLFVFLDAFNLINDSGGGILVQPWVVSMKSGNISWFFIE